MRWRLAGRLPPPPPLPAAPSLRLALDRSCRRVLLRLLPAGAASAVGNFRYSLGFGLLRPRFNVTRIIVRHPLRSRCLREVPSESLRDSCRLRSTVIGRARTSSVAWSRAAACCSAARGVPCSRVAHDEDWRRASSSLSRVRARDGARVPPESRSADRSILELFSSRGALPPVLPS